MSNHSKMGTKTNLHLSRLMSKSWSWIQRKHCRSYQPSPLHCLLERNGCWLHELSGLRQRRHANGIQRTRKCLSLQRLIHDNPYGWMKNELKITCYSPHFSLLKNAYKKSKPKINLWQITFGRSILYLIIELSVTYTEVLNELLIIKGKTLIDF